MSLEFSFYTPHGSQILKEHCINIVFSSDLGKLFSVIIKIHIWINKLFCQGVQCPSTILLGNTCLVGCILRCFSFSILVHIYETASLPFFLSLFCCVQFCTTALYYYLYKTCCFHLHMNFPCFYIIKELTTHQRPSDVVFFCQFLFHMDCQKESTPGIILMHNCYKSK